MTTEQQTIRNNGYYIAVAMALFGLIVSNFKTLFTATWGENSILWFLGLADGRAAACCVMLAGCAITLYTENERYLADLKPVRRKQRRLYIISALFLILGLLLLPLWKEDLLYALGLFLPLGIFMINRSKRAIWGVAIMLMVAFVALALLEVNYYSGWNSLSKVTPTYDQIFNWGNITRHLFFNGFYPVFPWATFMLVGVWLGRYDVSDEIVRSRLIIGAGTVTVLTSMVSQFNLEFMQERVVMINGRALEMLLHTRPAPPSPLFVLSAGGLAVVLILFSIAVAQRWPSSKWLAPIIHFGQMPMTIYVFHVLAGLFIPGWLQLPQTLPIEALVLYALVFIATSSAFAHLWRLRFERGPVEWLLRSTLHLVAKG